MPRTRDFALCLLPFFSLISFVAATDLPCAVRPRTLPPLPLPPLPSASQLAWQQGEMALFLHFGPNTFTDSEWGSGRADPSVFNPTALDARQWVAAAAAAGFSRIVLTAKHHDGFCLWPSAYTNYSVSSGPWRSGAGDVVADLAAAAREAGLNFGIYLSPWDRHEPCYGITLEYNEYYLGQMTELLTRYGDIQEVWLDGAKGEGERDMVYLFDSWFQVIHQLQPRAVIFSDAGPDCRWIGDETGVAGTTCWSLFNRSTATIGDIDTQYSLQGDPNGHDWVAPECDVSIRPGWFWHSSEQPKSPLTLLDIYYRSVGRNCLLLLNVPPNSSGLISEDDLQVLQNFTAMRRTIFLNSLAQDAVVSAGSTRGGPNDSLFSPLNVIQRGIYSYWAPDECKDNWTIVLDLGKLASFNVLEVQEPIQMGQRVIAFHADVLREGEWMKITNGTTIGYKRLLLFPVVNSQFLRFVIDKSRADPLISYLGIYLDLFSSTAHYSLNSSSNSTSDVEFINQKPNNNYSMNIGSA